VLPDGFPAVWTVDFPGRFSPCSLLVSFSHLVSR
jgi:hypothetical protein